MRRNLLLLVCVLAVFVLRVQAEEPLPLVDTVLERMLEQVKNERTNEMKFKANYSYTRSKKTVFKNGRGAVKKTKAKTKQNLPVIVPATSEAAADAPEPAVPAKEKPYEESDFPMGQELLSRFSFTLVGREIVNGRSVLVIDFEPAKKKLSEKNLKEKFLNKAAGRAWVDEQEAVVVKASVRLTDSVSVIGGLVGAVHKFTYNLLRHRTEDGLWFTKHSDWHVEGREVIVNRIIDFTEETEDVVRVK